MKSVFIPIVILVVYILVMYIRAIYIVAIMPKEGNNTCLRLLNDIKESRT